jgi:signal transduction histidine kinase
MHELGASDCPDPGRPPEKPEPAPGPPEEKATFLDLLQNTTQLGVGVTDDQGRLIHLNRGLAALLNRAPEELQGRTFIDILVPEEHGPAPGAPPPNGVWSPSLEGSGEWMVPLPGGGSRWLSVRRQTVAAPDGRRLTLFTFLDVTERKNREEELQQVLARSGQRQRQESLDRLVGGLAHRFNNLLTTILGYADLARGLLPSQSPLEPMLHEVIQAAHRAADLTQQLLAFAGKGRFVLQLVDLSQLVRDLTPSLQRVTSLTTQLQCQLADNLPLVEADVTRLRQVLTNLVANACEALEDRPGTVTVRTGTLMLEETSRYFAAPADQPAGNYVFLTVEDTGPGMAPAIRERIFEPFFSTKFQGRGMGLAAVLGIIQSHKGLIQVGSEPGKGSSFQVLLPARAGHAPVSGEERDAKQTRPALGLVLTVEDNEGAATLVRLTLEGAGYRVLTAGNSQAAIDLFEKHSTDIELVLLNYTLPDLTGTQVLARLPQLRPQQKVVLMTGHNPAELHQQYPELSFAAVLQKPFTPSELLDVVRRLLPAPEDRH